MSKSLKFCKEIASNPNRSSYSDRDWSKAVESMDTEAYFDKVLEGRRNVVITAKDNEDKPVSIKIKYDFNKDANFDHFTSESIIHDGTLLFVQDTINACMKKVLYGLTYNKEMQPPHDSDTIEYTVGNFVILNEYNNKSFSDDKPYLCSRTTVLLPLKYKIKDGGRG